MNIHLADSLEEFDLRYIESCNQCISTVYSDGDYSRRKSIDSKTSQLTLSSPLLNDDDYPKFNSNAQRFPIFDDTKVKVQLTSNNTFKKPPLKPTFSSEIFKYKQKSTKNLGNPFYKPSPSFIKSKEESPTKKRKMSLNHSLSSFESLLSLDSKTLAREIDNSDEKVTSDSEADSETESHDSTDANSQQ